MGKKITGRISYYDRHNTPETFKRLLKKQELANSILAKLKERKEDVLADLYTVNGYIRKAQYHVDKISSRLDQFNYERPVIDRQLLNSSDACQYAYSKGITISPRMLRDAALAGKIDAVIQQNKRRFYTKDSLDRWIKGLLR